MSTVSRPHLSARVVIAAHCMLALASLLPSQEVVLKAGSIDALWTGADGVLRVQCDRRIVVCTDPLASVAIPADAVAFDHGAALAWATEKGIRVEGKKPFAADGPFALRADPGSAPLRAPLFLSDRFLLHPTETSVSAIDLSSGGRTELGARAQRSHDRGFGLTGQVIDDLVVPHVFGRAHGGSFWAVVGENGSYVRVAGGRRTPLPFVELKDEAPIEGFEHTVAPLFADLDHDGVPDLVRVDAKTGIVAVQTGLEKDPIPPPRVILLKSPILAMDAADMNGDGKPELIVLRLPPLTPLQQLAILTQSKLSATLLVYALDGHPAAAPSPLATLDLSIGVRIVVSDQVRRAELQDLVAFANGKVLLAAPGKKARLITASDGAETALGLVPAGSWIEPLRQARSARAVFGVLRSGESSMLVRFDF